MLSILKHADSEDEPRNKNDSIPICPEIFWTSVGLNQQLEELEFLDHVFPLVRHVQVRIASFRENGVQLLSARVDGIVVPHLEWTLHVR